MQQDALSWDSPHSWPSHIQGYCASNSSIKSSRAILATIDAAAMDRDRSSPFTTQVDGIIKFFGARFPSINAKSAGLGKVFNRTYHGKVACLKNIDLINLGHGCMCNAHHRRFHDLL
jgi:hypothetical protein